MLCALAQVMDRSRRMRQILRLWAAGKHLPDSWMWRAARQRAVNLVMADFIRWVRDADVLPHCSAVICLYFIEGVGCGWGPQAIGFGPE